MTMEPLEPKAITKIALFQVLGLMYGVFICALSAKMSTGMMAEDASNSKAYWWPYAYTEYGWLLFVFILAWTMVGSYYAYPPHRKLIKPSILYNSGMTLLAILILVPTILAGIPFFSMSLLNR